MSTHAPAPAAASAPPPALNQAQKIKRLLVKIAVFVGIGSAVWVGYLLISNAHKESVAAVAKARADARQSLAIDKIKVVQDRDEAPAAVTFEVVLARYADAKEKLFYSWNFDDGTPAQVTTTNVVKYVYRYGKTTPYKVYVRVAYVSNESIYDDASVNVVVTGSPQPAATSNNFDVFHWRNPAVSLPEAIGEISRKIRFNKGGPPAQTLKVGDNFVELKEGDTRRLLEAPLHTRLETPEEVGDEFSTWESAEHISAEESAQHQKETGASLVSQRVYLVNGLKGKLPRTVRVTVTPR